MLYRVLAFLVLAVMLSGCESRVKYPSPAAIYYSYPTKSKRIPSKEKEMIHRLKRRVFIRNCKDGIKYYLTKSSVYSKICLGYYYIKCGYLRRADGLLVDLVNKQLSNRDYGKAYALLGLVRTKEGLNGENYFELSYAYDPKNRVSRYMLSVGSPNFKFALRFADRWCSK